MRYRGRAAAGSVEIGTELLHGAATRGGGRGEAGSFQSMYSACSSLLLSYSRLALVWTNERARMLFGGCLRVTRFIRDISSTNLEFSLVRYATRHGSREEHVRSRRGSEVAFAYFALRQADVRVFDTSGFT